MRNAREDQTYHFAIRSDTSPNGLDQHADGSRKRIARGERGRGGGDGRETASGLGFSELEATIKLIGCGFDCRLGRTLLASDKLAVQLLNVTSGTDETSGNLSALAYESHARKVRYTREHNRPCRHDCWRSRGGSSWPGGPSW